MTTLVKTVVKTASKPSIFVHKWVDFVYKCQNYNQRELQRLVTGHRLIYGMDFSILIIVIFLTHHWLSDRNCRLKLLQRQMTAILCRRLRWPVFLISLLHERSSIARRQVVLCLEWVWCLDDGGDICLQLENMNVHVELKIAARDCTGQVLLTGPTGGWRMRMAVMPWLMTPRVIWPLPISRQWLRPCNYTCANRCLVPETRTLGYI